MICRSCQAKQSQSKCRQPVMCQNRCTEERTAGRAWPGGVGPARSWQQELRRAAGPQGNQKRQGAAASCAHQGCDFQTAAHQTYFPGGHVHPQPGGGQACTDLAQAGTGLALAGAGLAQAGTGLTQAGAGRGADCWGDRVGARREHIGARQGWAVPCVADRRPGRHTAAMNARGWPQRSIGRSCT